MKTRNTFSLFILLTLCATLVACSDKDKGSSKPRPVDPYAQGLYGNQYGNQYGGQYGGQYGQQGYYGYGQQQGYYGQQGYYSQQQWGGGGMQAPCFGIYFSNGGQGQCYGSNCSGRWLTNQMGMMVYCQ